MLISKTFLTMVLILKDPPWMMDPPVSNDKSSPNSAPLSGNFVSNVAVQIILNNLLIK